MSSKPFLSQEVKLKRFLIAFSASLIRLINIPGIFYCFLNPQPVVESKEGRTVPDNQSNDKFKVTREGLLLDRKIMCLSESMN